jgi:hypothetical protein
MASVAELPERFVSTFNESKLEEGLADFAEDAVLEEVGTGRRLTARETLENSKAWKAAFPDAHGVIESTLVDGNRGAAEIVYEALPCRR